MNLSRRDFLAGVAVVTAAPLLPQIPIAPQIEGVVISQPNAVFRMFHAVHALALGDVVTYDNHGNAMKAGSDGHPIGVVVAVGNDTADVLMQ